MANSRRVRMQLKREIRKQTYLHEPHFPDILVLITRIDTSSDRSDPPPLLESVRDELRAMGLNTFLVRDVREILLDETFLKDIVGVCNAVVFVRLKSSATNRHSSVETMLDQLRPQPGIEYPIERRAIFFVEDDSSPNCRRKIDDNWGYPNTFQSRVDIARETWWEVQDIIGWEKDGTLPIPPGSQRKLNNEW